MSSVLRGLDAKYELIGKLSEGGMGAIYKVRHRHLDALRVIKVMRTQHENDPELRERFLREARAATLLRHPHIAETFDFTLHDTATPFIETDFILALHSLSPLSPLGPF